LYVWDGSRPYTIGASIYGYKAGPSGDEHIVSIPASGIASNINFVFEPLPRISISAPAQLVEGSAGAFTISRTGSTDEPLDVWWQTTGTADNSDFNGPYGAGVAKIPAGSSSTTLPITELTTAEIRAEKIVTLHASAPATITRGDVTYSYPGWELRSVGAEQKWFQVDPPYATFAEAAATIRLIDALDPTAFQIALLTDASREKILQIVAPAGKILQLQQSKNLREWQTIATRPIDVSPITIRISEQLDANFYRAEVSEP
jgi:hypothetical protein